MIKKDIIDLVNNNEMWAFVGSGPSIDSGLLSWSNLIDNCIKRIGLETSIAYNKDYHYLLSKNDFPTCFGIIENLSSREILVSTIKNILQQGINLSKILKTIVRMPFVGYITTNYDNLIELALLDAGIGGFASIGNTIEQFTNPDNDLRGPWTSGNMVDLASEEARPNLHYNLVDPNSGIIYKKPKLGWRFDKKRMQMLIKENKILWPKNSDGRPRQKVFLSELAQEYTGYSSIVGTDIYTRNGTTEIEEIFKGL